MTEDEDENDKSQERRQSETTKVRNVDRAKRNLGTGARTAKNGPTLQKTDEHREYQ